MQLISSFGIILTISLQLNENEFRYYKVRLLDEDGEE